MKHIVLLIVCSTFLCYGMEEESVPEKKDEFAIFDLFEQLTVSGGDTLDTCIHQMTKDIDQCIKGGCSVNVTKKSYVGKQTIIDRAQAVVDLMSDLPEEDDDNENYIFVYKKFVEEVKKRGGKSCKELEQRKVNKTSTSSDDNFDITRLSSLDIELLDHYWDGYF